MLPKNEIFTNCCYNICHILQNGHHGNVYVVQTENINQKILSSHKIHHWTYYQQIHIILWCQEHIFPIQITGTIYYWIKSSKLGALSRNHFILLLPFFSLLSTLLYDFMFVQSKSRFSDEYRKSIQTYLYMPDTSMPTKITFTGIQTLTSFQFSLSSDTNPKKCRSTTKTVLSKFCKK